ALRGGGRAPRGGAAAADRAVDATPPEAERRLDAAAPAAQENTWASACLARATGRLWDDASTLASAVKIWESIGARFERACTLLLLPGRVSEGHAEFKRLGVRTAEFLHRGTRVGLGAGALHAECLSTPPRPAATNPSRYRSLRGIAGVGGTAARVWVKKSARTGARGSALTM